MKNISIMTEKVLNSIFLSRRAAKVRAITDRRQQLIDYEYLFNHLRQAHQSSRFMRALEEFIQRSVEDYTHNPSGYEEFVGIARELCRAYWEVKNKNNSHADLEWMQVCWNWLMNNWVEHFKTMHLNNDNLTEWNTPWIVLLPLSVQIRIWRNCIIIFAINLLLAPLAYSFELLRFLVNFDEDFYLLMVQWTANIFSTNWFSDFLTILSKVTAVLFLLITEILSALVAFSPYILHCSFWTILGLGLFFTIIYVGPYIITALGFFYFSLLAVTQIFPNILNESDFHQLCGYIIKVFWFILEFCWHKLDLLLDLIKYNNERLYDYGAYILNDLVEPFFEKLYKIIEIKQAGGNYDTSLFDYRPLHWLIFFVCLGLQFQLFGDFVSHSDYRKPVNLYYSEDFMFIHTPGTTPFNILFIENTFLAVGAWASFYILTSWLAYNL